MTPDQVRLVTVSASYGAGGSVVAPALADRLGVPFLQRATTSAGGVGAAEPCAERLAPTEADLTPAHWLLACLTAAMPTGPTQSPPPARHTDEFVRSHCEEGIRRLADAGAAVHSYVVAFWVSAAIFAAAAVVCGLVLRSGVLTQQGRSAAPAVA